MVIFSGVDPAIPAELAAHGIEAVELGGLTAEGSRDAELVAQRMIATAQDVARRSDAPIAFLAAGAAGAGALIAASQRPDLEAAVLAINARTDHAYDYLRELRTPTFLLINDMPVLRMNREALALLRCERRIEVVHGTEPEAARLMVEKAVRWVCEHLALQPAQVS